jgi:hypothetical protein
MREAFTCRDWRRNSKRSLSIPDFWETNNRKRFCVANRTNQWHELGAMGEIPLWLFLRAPEPKASVVQQVPFRFSHALPICGFCGIVKALRLLSPSHRFV